MNSETPNMMNEVIIAPSVFDGWGGTGG